MRPAKGKGPRLRVVPKVTARERAEAWVRRSLMAEVERMTARGVQHVNGRGKVLKTPEAVVRCLQEEGAVCYRGALVLETYTRAVENREAYEKHTEVCSSCARSLN